MPSVAKRLLEGTTAANDPTAYGIQWYDEVTRRVDANTLQSTYSASRSRALLGYTVSGGRAGTTGPVDPLTATVTLSTERLRQDSVTAGVDQTPQPDAGMRLQLSTPAAQRLGMGLTPRFTGRITSVTVGRYVTTVQAVSYRAQLARVVLSNSAADAPDPITTPWPIETDMNRVQRLWQYAIARAPFPMADKPTVGTVGHMPFTVNQIPSTYFVTELLPQNVTLLQLFEDLADSQDSQLTENRHGQFGWLRPVDRKRDIVLTADPSGRELSTGVRLNSGQVMSDGTAHSDAAELVNYLTVAYGPEGQFFGVYVDDGLVDADGTDRQQAHVTTQSTDTQNPDGFWPNVRGQLLIARRSTPYWQLDNLTVPLVPFLRSPTSANLTTLRRLLQLDHGSLVLLTGRPDWLPDGVPSRVFVEGWTETMTRDSWQLELAVSDVAQSGPEITWRTYAPTPSTWAAAPTSVRWRIADRYAPFDD